MAKDWEQVFRSWRGPASDTEEEKCENATRMVKDAVRAGTFSGHDVEVFPQGSYHNNTNVKRDSDVDICVCCTDVTSFDFSAAPLLSLQAVGFTPVAYSATQFRAEVEKALVEKFGREGVTPGTKAFDVHANTYRVDADVVPTFKLRMYWADGSHVEGTCIEPPNGRRIYNFPHQHHARGVLKNVATGHRFKQVARVIKRLRNEMKDDGVAAAGPMASFLLECLAYNTPDAAFVGDSYKAMVREVLMATYAATKPGASAEWLEVNGIKFLFHPAQGWTREQVNAFTVAAWQHVGFE